ncbi:MAG: 2Fe-2S iron-sulfur cluster-binding protein, partial [Thermoproteus sp.]
MEIRLKVNGRSFVFVVPPRMLLAHLLRDRLGIRSVRIGCDTGHCGACTVLLNGEPVKSCNVFAFMADGGEVVTLEGLNDRLAAAL